MEHETPETRAVYPCTLEYLPEESPLLETRQRGDMRVSGGAFRGGGGVIRGVFPYNKLAVTRDRGKVRKERVKDRAFAHAIEDPEARIELLSGHSYAQPLASRSAGSLRVWDDSKAVRFEARLPPPEDQPTWMRDSVKAITLGLFAGISPGFRVPPKSVVPGAETFAEDPEADGILIREINDAVLYELSLVTRPAYLETVLETGRGEDEPEDETIPQSQTEEEEDDTRSEPLASEIERRAMLWL